MLLGFRLSDWLLGPLPRSSICSSSTPAKSITRSPVPAVYILGTDGTIKFVHFDPDYRERMDPAKILEEAKAALPK